MKSVVSTWYMAGSRTRILLLTGIAFVGTLATAAPITLPYDFSASAIGATQNITGLDLTAAVAAAAADPATGSWELKPIGAPLGTGVLKMEITIVVNGNKVTKPVTIPKGDIVAYVRPDRMAGEKDKDYANRIADALGEASQAKSKVIADAINTAFADEFKKLGETAGTGLTAVNKKIRVPGNVTDYNTSAFYGTVIIPGVSKELGNPVKFTEGKILGEGGNGGSYIKPAGPSPGSRGSLERATPAVETVATGADPYGDPSVVDFGLVGIYVASFTPSPGMTDGDVLSTLASMLNQNNVSATFDSFSDRLLLNDAIPDGTVLDWGSTDTGLEFTMSMEGLQPATVPEPSTGLLLLILAAVFLLAKILFYWQRSAFSWKRRLFTSGPNCAGSGTAGRLGCHTEVFPGHAVSKRRRLRRDRMAERYASLSERISGCYRSCPYFCIYSRWGIEIGRPGGC